MLVSVAQKKDLYAYVVNRDGEQLAQETGKFSSSDTEDHYQHILKVLGKALSKVKQVFETSENKDTEVVIEIANSVIIKWVDTCKVPDKYIDDYMQLMSVINKIPMTYTFRYESKPEAHKYLREWAVEEEEVFGVDALLSM